MNTDTGHLVRSIEEVAPRDRAKYTPVPRRLHRAARAKLKGQADAMVDLTRRDQLAKWARADRRRKKARRRLEKAGRKAARR